MNPTPLQQLRHKKGWRLIHVYQKLKQKKIPVSWPILINIDRGYKNVIVRNPTGENIGTKRKKHVPGKQTKENIAKLFKVKPEDVYEDRSLLK